MKGLFIMALACAASHYSMEKELFTTQKRRGHQLIHT